MSTSEQQAEIRQHCVTRGPRMMPQGPEIHQLSCVVCEARLPSKFSVSCHCVPSVFKTSELMEICALEVPGPPY